MCRIDEQITHLYLEEKTDPIERIVQALDGNGATGDFRSLLEKFVPLWRRIVNNDISKFEKALQSTQQAEGLQKKVTIFLQNLHYSSCRILLMMRYGGLRDRYQEHDPDRFEFENYLAREVFPESVYGFFQCLSENDLPTIDFEGFYLNLACYFYDDPHHRTSLLCDDKQINDLGESARWELLWRIFEKQNLTDPDKSFEFLQTWLKADAQSKPHAEFLVLLTKTLDQPTTRQWPDDQCHRLVKACCCSVNLNGMSPEIFDKLATCAHESWLLLSPAIGKEQAEALIDWGIKKNIEAWLKEHDKSKTILQKLLTTSSCSPISLLYISPFWKSHRAYLVTALDSLAWEDRLTILSKPLHDFGTIRLRVPRSIVPLISVPPKLVMEESADPALEMYPYEVEQEDREWWDALLLEPLKDKAFPKGLWPQWTVTAVERFGYDRSLVPHADKSVGILRGLLCERKDPATKNEVEHLNRLLEILEMLAPEKALRHHLLLFRASPHPCTTEKLDCNRDSLCPLSMSGLITQFEAQSRNRHIVGTGEEQDAKEKSWLCDFRNWFAEFCLSRLKLRKGEKKGEGSYDAGQVVEPSSVWRQGYLKALGELGIDLGGKVHKAVYFTRNFDPDGDVQAVAKEVYKSVRRDEHKSISARDIRKGLIAAYWWLQWVQRISLNAPIDEQEALRTRRRLLRH